jgi:2-keto-4-pentenoate hydratase/2-oxohepta-3-ene-1,7-dioic acid hydratase in catechol pathway
MVGYRLASFQVDQGPRPGVVMQGRLYDIGAVVGHTTYATVQDVLEDWDRAHAVLDAASHAPQGQSWPIDSVQLLAPVAKPGAIYCVGANYQDHAEEMSRAMGRPRPVDPHTLGLKPWFFVKSSHCVTGPNSSISFTHYSKQLDWELELVVVIGRKSRALSVDQALDCIAGYMIGNDLSARDLFIREQLPQSSPMRADWTRHKSFDGAAPMGPWITPAPYVRNPSDLSMKLWVNDALEQDSNSSQMIFTIAEQIAHLSSGITLYPGDLIMTGTPAGVGAGKGKFLNPGDVVNMEIADIGSMSFKMIA